MIQIPITLPKWDNQDIINLVRDFVKKRVIDDKYKNIIDKNIELISTAIENNPREIKRFLNNFIVAFEIFSPSKHKVVPTELLVIQAIQLRWNKFYDLLIKSDENFREELSKYLTMNEEILLKNLESDEIKKDEESYDLQIRKMLRDFKTDIDLWSFLKKNSTTLNNIKDWNIYRRAAEVGIERTIQKSFEEFEEAAIKYFENLQKIKENDKEVYELLLNGKINIFNERRKRGDFKVLYLSGAKLSGAKLSGADLEKADLSGADLEKADLTRAFLSGANLTEADLTGAFLPGADLRNSIIINPLDYDSLVIDKNTNFYGGITDNWDFIDYISKFTKNVPEKIKDKKELKIKLKVKGLPENIVDDLLKMSKLPN